MKWFLVGAGLLVFLVLGILMIQGVWLDRKMKLRQQHGAAKVKKEPKLAIHRFQPIFLRC